MIDLGKEIGKDLSLGLMDTCEPLIWQYDYPIEEEVNPTVVVKNYIEWRITYDEAPELV